MFPRPTKRQRLEQPPSWMDCENIATVASPYAEMPLQTPIASQLTKEIFLERFQKEVLEPFHFSLSSQLQVDPNTSLVDTKQCRSILKQRIIVGTNACTRVLEAACTQRGTPPRLVVLTTDTPPTILVHVPVLCQQHQIPMLLLGGPASLELGKVLGTKKVGIFAFSPHAGVYPGTPLQCNVHSAVDSFVDFVQSKIPKEL